MIRGTVIGLLVLAPACLGETLPWWDGGVLGQLMYRVPVEVTNRQDSKDDYPITVELNFTDVLLDLGEVGALDEGSIRVIRSVKDTAEAFGTALPHLFERAPDYGTISNAHGWISWIVEQSLDPEEEVLYHIYFDIQAHGVRLEPVPLSWETVYYNPANRIQGGSLEPEAASVDQSSNPWRGWGEGRQPPSVQPQQSGHWGRWSLALVPGGSATCEALVGLLDAGRSYLLGCYLRADSTGGEPGVLNMSFSLGGTRAIRFSKEQTLAPALGWWRCEVPLPIAPESSPFSIVFDFAGMVPDTVWVDDLFIYEDPPLVTVGVGERLQ